MFLGSSAAVNCVAAVRVAQSLGPGHVVVTVLCDGGQRHLTKFHSDAYLKKLGLLPQPSALTLGALFGGGGVDQKKNESKRGE